jgi:hypothetical protein
VRTLAAILFLVLMPVAIAGCGGGGSGDSDGTRSTSPEKPRRSSRPALCGELTESVTGRLNDASVAELSGLVASRRQDGVLWAIEDSGNTASLVALRADGTFRGRFPVTGAQNVDWEDVAAAGEDLYAADIGDNMEARDSIVVYRVPEPDANAGAGTPTAPATALVLRYPDGAHDAESLLVDPRTRRIIVITKDFLGPGRVYVAPAEGGDLVDTGAKIDAEGPLTGAGLSPDGRTVAVRAYTRIYAWKRRSGERLEKTLRRRPCVSPTLLEEGQGEAIAVLRRGRSVLTVAEGVNPPIRRYEAR